MSSTSEGTTSVGHGERRVVVLNFFWLSTSQMAGRVVGLFTGVYTRRVLGPVVIGQYSWCLSALSYFFLLTNPGLETVAKRDVARDPNKSALLLSKLLALELTFAVLAFGLVALLCVSRLRGPTVSQLLALSAIGMFLLPFNLAWLLQAHERMVPAAVGQVIFQILKLPALILLVRSPAHVFRYAVLDYPFQLAMMGFLLWYANCHRLLPWSEVQVSLRGTGALLTEALPLGLSQAAILLYYNCDVILLGLWSSDKAVGFYSTAYNVMLMPTFLSGALFSAYFPQLSRVHGDHEQSKKVSSDFLRILTWIGMPIAAMGWAFGRHAIVLLYGREFEQSGPLLEWLSLNIALIFFNVGVGNPFDAWGLQVPHFRVGCVGAVLNVALNCMLIPSFGAWAAVATTIIAEMVVGVGCLAVRSQHVQLPWWSIVGKPFLFSLSTALIGRYLAYEFPDQWFSMLILVGSGILVAFWISEKDSLMNVLRSLRKMAESQRNDQGLLGTGQGCGQLN